MPDPTCDCTDAITNRVDVIALPTIGKRLTVRHRVGLLVCE